MKITVEGNIFEGTPEEIKEMMTLMGAEFPESTKPKVEEEEAETNPKTEKRKARVGERILITNADSPGGQYKNGDILTVSKGFGKLGSPHAIQADGVDIGIYHNEYEVIIEESTPKFKEGDRVKALADGEFSDVIEGEIGTINSIIEDEDVSYNIAVKTSDDYDYFRPQDLELIAEEAVQFGKIGRKPGEFKKGDIVRVKQSYANGSNHKEGDIGVITTSPQDDDELRVKTARIDSINWIKPEHAEL